MSGVVGFALIVAGLCKHQNIKPYEVESNSTGILDKDSTLILSECFQGDSILKWIEDRRSWY